MNTNELLDMATYAGRLLIESGAEIYRVEETMVRLCTSFEGVSDAQSFVTPTGIMFSITVRKETFTKILRVHSRGVNLHCIDEINALSRIVQTQECTIAQIQTRLEEIAHEKRYSVLVTLLFGALGAAGFAIFYHGSIVEVFCAFVIGICIKIATWFFERKGLNSFFTNAFAAGIAAFCALVFERCIQGTNLDIMIISSIMLLVPGLAITNAIRDTVAGDYLSGVSRATEAFLIAIAIAAGIGFVLSVSLNLQGGM